MDRYESRSAVITGASQGIGKAIAIAFAREGIDIYLAGRSIDKLEEVRDQIAGNFVKPQCMRLDLSNLSDIARFADEIRRELPKLNILVNCAGIFECGPFAATSVERFDRLYATNVRGPMALTTNLLPQLKGACGDIVFINSSVVFSTAQDVGHYAATQHALLGAANALRAEVNDQGVRVLTVYPGRTATPLQLKIFETEGRTYKPDQLLQPSDIASIVVACLKLPNTAEVVDLHIRPRQKWKANKS